MSIAYLPLGPLLNFRYDLHDLAVTQGAHAFWTGCLSVAGVVHRELPGKFAYGKATSVDFLEARLDGVLIDLAWLDVLGIEADVKAALAA